MDNPGIETAGISAVQPYVTDSPGETLVLDIFSDTEEIRTRFLCPSGYRITDILNRVGEGIPGQNSFIELVDGETKQELFISKEVIQFVAVDDANAGRGFGSDPRHTHYPVVEKLPIKVNVQLKSYRLIGKAYQAKGKTLKAVLGENIIFLPLTDVIILRESKLIGEKPFVAVNKKQIISLKKDLIS